MQLRIPPAILTLLLLFSFGNFACSAMQFKQTPSTDSADTAPVNQQAEEKTLRPTRGVGRATDREILNLFPKSTVIRADSQTTTTIRSTFLPSTSLWAEGLSEENVFQAEMVSEREGANLFSLRLGRGGQIYSLRGSFGESVPPSWRAKNTPRSPWNDEVWQFVAVCTRYNLLRNLEKGKDKIAAKSLKQINDLPYSNHYFIHNSGAYIPNNAELDSLYCPLLAVNQTGESYQMLNWGLVPQIKTMHRSPILYFTQIRDAGNGVIEMTWVVHNFSVRDDIVFDHLNAPWGGTRVSNLPFKYAVTREKKLVDGNSILHEKYNTIDVRKTAGWDIACASEAEDAPSLALVYGRDKHLEAERVKQKSGQPFCQTNHSLYRAWRSGKPIYKHAWKDWQTRPANSFRNYDVCEITPKLKLEPGKTIWFRSYLVVGNKEEVIKTADSLVDHVDYGLIDFAPESTSRIRVFNAPEGLAIQTSTGEAETIIPRGDRGLRPFVQKPFRLMTKPVPGSQPIFLITDTRTEQPVLTTDPYLFAKQEELDLPVPKSHPDYDYYSSVVGYSLDESNSDWQSLIGFGYKERPKTGNWQQLSSLIDSTLFPAATKFHLDLWVEVDGSN